MKRLSLVILFALSAQLLAAASTPSAPTLPLTEARRGFETKLLERVSIGEEAETPPAGVLKRIDYAAPLGRNAAYVSPDPGDGKKHPAIIWLTGGFSNSIGAIAWTPGPVTNDQSASGFREAGILMMYPSLRGGNKNPGYLETFYGEVDDVLAAANVLAELSYVDPNRIYLGGHSTGGTLALLAAAAGGERFRAVFALGPVDNVVGYGTDMLLFDAKNPKEVQVRAPVVWIASIPCPTYLVEGTEGNITSLRTMKTRTRGKNPRLHFVEIPNATHFSIIAPLVKQISQSILADGPASSRFTLKQPQK